MIDVYVERKAVYSIAMMDYFIGDELIRPIKIKVNTSMILNSLHKKVYQIDANTLVSAMEIIRKPNKSPATFRLFVDAPNLYPLFHEKSPGKYLFISGREQLAKAFINGENDIDVIIFGNNVFELFRIANNFKTTTKELLINNEPIPNRNN
jgi:hypothetical protein